MSLQRVVREISWALGAKFAVLGVLWALFFSAAHQPNADAAATSRQLAVDPPVGQPVHGPESHATEKLLD